MTPKLSIVIANRNDTSMLAVTVRSCIEELRPLGRGIGEIIVVDNSDPETWEAVRNVLPMDYVKDGLLKIHRQDFPCLFTARETAVERACGEYVLCLDSHMIVGRDTFIDMLEFMEDRCDDPTIGFAHAPITWAHKHERYARHDRDMSVNELGDWGRAYNHERPITWKGMPWICRRHWFLRDLGGYGTLSKYRVSWGGGDMHIGIKPWLLGFKNWAIPTNPCIHIGPFPGIDSGDNPNIAKAGNGKYRLYTKSGNFPHAFGFLISCYVLGGVDMMRRNKDAIISRFGKFIDVEKWWAPAIKLGQAEKNWLDARKVMTFEQLLERKPWNDQLDIQQTA